MKKAIRLLAVVFFLSVTVPGTSVLAVEMSAMERKVSITVREQPVQQFLETLFSQINVPVDVSEEIEGLMNGRFQGTAQEVFDQVAKAFNVTLYFDGVVAHIYRGNEITRTLMPVSVSTAERVQQMAQRMSLGDRNNILDASSGGLLVIGTRRFLEQIEELSFSVQANNASPTEKVPLAYRVFYLSNAWAADTNFDVGGQNITISGVATLLSQLVHDGRLPASLEPRLPAKSRNSLEGLRGRGLQAVNDADASVVETQVEDSTAVFSQTDTGARIVADSRLNAVIIRDAADRMQAYQELIKDLDRPSQMVEIEATIIDVNTDKTRELGVGWQYRRSDVNFSSIGGTSDGQTGTIFPGAQVQGAGAILSTVLGAKEQFLARIRALEEKGAARVVSKPHVITLSDVEAVLGATTEFFVRVAGDEEVDLFNVPVGTTLRVTPHVFQDTGQSRIKLLVNIEDGTASAREVDQIPVVERANINTQAVINEGDSLLIGGLVRDSYQEIATGVPLLGSIPVIGRLFKSTSNRSNRVERLFMITPRTADGLGFGRVHNGKRALPVLQGDIDDIQAQTTDRARQPSQPFGNQIEDVPFNPLQIPGQSAPSAQSSQPAPAAPATQQRNNRPDDAKFNQWVAVPSAVQPSSERKAVEPEPADVNRWSTIPVISTNRDTDTVGETTSSRSLLSDEDGWTTIQ